jgi:uncharacterized protein YqhQ
MIGIRVTVMTKTQIEKIISRIRLLPGVDAIQYKHLTKAITELEAAMALIAKPRFFSRMVAKSSADDPKQYVNPVQ